MCRSASLFTFCIQGWQGKLPCMLYSAGTDQKTTLQLFLPMAFRDMKRTQPLLSYCEKQAFMF